MGKETLDPVTFEVLKNSFITSVDQMAEQVIRTCYSFVIYNRDFSNGLHDAQGNSVAQGNGENQRNYHNRVDSRTPSTITDQETPYRCHATRQCHC